MNTDILGNQYICSTTVVLIIFNRPTETRVLIDSIRLVRPQKLIVLADGPRESHPKDILDTRLTRDEIDLIDWDCEITKLYNKQNLGCMRNIVTGLTSVFDMVDKAIILEDDCKPTVEFFKFVEWGLVRYQEDSQIGMISGSNLIANKLSIPYRNGFSMLINIWGWGTWSNRWKQHNPFLSAREVNEDYADVLKAKGFNLWQRIYWRELLNFTIYSSDTWDFQLQYSFFKKSLLSVYPQRNLIHNIGFDGNGTHTNIDCPSYVKNNCPTDKVDVMSISENIEIRPSLERDVLLARIIWNFNVYSTLKLACKNFLVACHVWK